MVEQSFYEKLAATAKGHVLSCLPQTKGANDPDSDLILSYLDPSFKINWGHSFWTSSKPGLQGNKSGEGFVSHLNGMAKTLQTWSIDITDMSVDVEKRSVVLRGDFHMVPKGGEEVLNDIVFWVWMNDAGDRVTRCTEFVDTVASEELAKRMQRA